VQAQVVVQTVGRLEIEAVSVAGTSFSKRQVGRAGGGGCGRRVQLDGQCW
jgi:hypothetical protein